MAKLEISKDIEKTLIFSKPKPKVPSKSVVTKKGTALKIILQKAITTSTTGPSNKGKGAQNLPTEEQTQDESKGPPVKENDPKAFLPKIHNFIL